MAHRFAWLLILAGLAAAGPVLAQVGSQPVDQLEALRKRLDAQKATPMAFFIAKGAPHSCGDDCDTWIAAEGPFDDGAAERLSRFLAARPGLKLPLYFHSGGGSVAQALAIGRQLRHRGMTAGVARTIPQGCNPSVRQDASCEALKRSGRELPAEMRLTAANCASACIYALVGAAVREIAPDVNLGVHSSIVYRIRANGEVLAPAPGQFERSNEQVKRYLTEMGIDQGLLAVTLETRNENMRYLTRGEIIGFRVDPRELIETRWSLNDAGQSPVVTKSMFERRDRGPHEYRWSDLRLSCAGSESVRIEYSRVLATPEEKVRAVVKLTAGEGAIDFPEARPAERPAPSITRSIVVPLSRLEAAATGPRFEITVAFTPKESESWSTVTKISTAGLSASLQQMRPRCGPTSPAAPELP